MSRSSSRDARSQPAGVAFLVVPIMAIIGYALQRGLFNRTLGGDLMPPLLVSFGLSVIIQNGLLQLFSADNRRLQAGAIEVASVRLSDADRRGVLPLLQLALAGLVIGGLQFSDLPHRHRPAASAVSDDPQIAQLMGLNNKHVFGLAMGLSLAIVALAGRADRHPRELRSGDRPDASYLRLRSRHHRRAQQFLGHARGRHHPRRRAVGRRRL